MSERQRVDFARSGRISKGAMRELASSGSPSVRAALVARRDIPLAWRMAIGRSADRQVARGWARAPLLTSSEMEILVLRHGDDGVVGALLAAREDLPWELLDELVAQVVDGRAIDRVVKALLRLDTPRHITVSGICALLRRWPSIPHSPHTSFALRRLLSAALEYVDADVLVGLLPPVMKRSPRASFEACNAWPSHILSGLPPEVFMSWILRQDDHVAASVISGLSARKRPRGGFGDAAPVDWSFSREASVSRAQ